VRSEEELPDLLAAVAATVSDALGFTVVVINLYRPAWDDFQTAVVHGSDAARDVLLGQSSTWESWTPLLDARFARRGASFIPHDQFDWDALPGATHIPDLEMVAGDDAWHPEDALFVPLRHTDGHLLGVLAVDVPVSGRRPSDDEIDVLVALADHAALAVQSAQEAVSRERHRRGLEQLLRVSASLNHTSDGRSTLLEICEGVRIALGFGKVSIDVVDEAGMLSAVVNLGWEEGETGTEPIPLDWLAALMRPEHEVEGCYLLAGEAVAAEAAIPPGTYRSTRDGRGPHAWRDHWLWVPLRGRDATMKGILWVDDPLDRCLPSRDRLQALRLFASQATTALDTAAQFEEMRFLAEHDPLTRLLNRRAFNVRLAEEATRATRYDRSFALVLCDLDRFKALNDDHGHLAGDAALERVGASLAGAIRRADAAFRIGGDEFALILVESSRDDARAVVDRIAASLGELDDPRFARLRLSFGVAIFPGDAHDPDELFRRADEAMYRAKRSGAPVRFAA
jgi:diguanylate cyclase (GGDEF)-like protein